MAPSTTATFLFTDMVDSTAVSAALQSAAAEELRRRHFAALREALAVTGGTEVKTVGDGLMAVFRSISAAVECGVRMQQRVQRDNRGARVPVGLRVGLGHGDAVEEDGDWFGLAVVEAARMCATAHGGQILAADTIRLLSGNRDGHVIAPVEPLALKGFADPVPACEIRWNVTVDDGLPPRLEAARSGRFVGRERERAILEHSAAAAAAGERQVVLLAGEPGIGKTTLAAEGAAAARRAGAVVLYGRCVEDLALPYGAWVEALSQYVEHVPADELAAHVAEHGGELGRLVPGLARRVPDVPEPHASDPDAERYLLFGAVAGLLASAARRNGAVVVLDDLHWADRPTLTLLRHLVGAAPALPILVVATYRTTDLGPGHPLNDSLADLHRERAVTRLSLDGLEDPEVVALLEAWAGHALDAAGERLAQTLRAETGGNPFFVTELVESLSESGGIVQAGGHWTASPTLSRADLPTSVREVVARRVRRLGPNAEHVLGAAAIIGGEFDAELLERVVGDEVTDALDTAVDAGLLIPLEPPGRFTFAHALVHRTLAAGVGAAHEQQLHRRVGAALEEVLAPDLTAHVQELAHHWLETGRPTDAVKAAGYARRAGDRALEQLAPDEAVRWYRRSLVALAAAYTPDEPARCDLLIRLGDALRQAGDPTFRETLLGAAKLASELADAALLARAALANSRGFVSASGAVDDERVAVLEEALAAVGQGDPFARAQLLALLAAELTFSGQWERRVALSDAAVSIARRLGEPETLAAVLTPRFTTIWTPESLPTRLAETHQAVALADRAGHPVAQFQAVHWRAAARVEQGDLAGARADVERETELAARLGQPTAQWMATYDRANLELVAGRLDAADDLAHAALAIATDSSQPDGLMFFASQLTNVRWEQGQLDDLRGLVAETVANVPGIPAFRAVLALASCGGEHADEARRLLAEDAAQEFRALPYDVTWLAGLSIYALVAVALREADAARRLHTLLAPWSDQVVFTGVSVWMAVSHHVGALAAVFGDHDEAARRLADAAGHHERMGAPVWLARTRVEIARLHLERDEPEQARPLLEAAIDVARRHGAGGVERQAADLLAGEPARVAS